MRHFKATFSGRLSLTPWAVDSGELVQWNWQFSVQRNHWNVVKYDWTAHPRHLGEDDVKGLFQENKFQPSKDLNSHKYENMKQSWKENVFFLKAVPNVSTIASLFSNVSDEKHKIWQNYVGFEKWEKVWVEYNAAKGPNIWRKRAEDYRGARTKKWMSKDGSLKRKLKWRNFTAAVRKIRVSTSFEVWLRST